MFLIDLISGYETQLKAQSDFLKSLTPALLYTPSRFFLLHHVVLHWAILAETRGHFYIVEIINSWSVG